MRKFPFKNVECGDTDDGNRNVFDILMAGLVFVYEGCWLCVHA